MLDFFYFFLSFDDHTILYFSENKTRRNASRGPCRHSQIKITDSKWINLCFATHIICRIIRACFNPGISINALYISPLQKRKKNLLHQKNSCNLGQTVPDGGQPPPIPPCRSELFWSWSVVSPLWSPGPPKSQVVTLG